MTTLPLLLSSSISRRVWRRRGGAFLPHEHPAVSRNKLPVVRKMPRTKNVPQRNEGAAAREQQRAAAFLAAAPAPSPAPHPNAPPLGAGASGPSGVTLKLEEEEEEGPRRDRAAPESARVPASGPRAALVAASAPAPAPDHDVPAAGGAGGSGVTLVKEEEEEEETLGQQRDRLALALAHGPVRVDSHIKVEDSTSGEDLDGDGEGEGEEGSGGDRGDGEGEEGLGGQGAGLVLLAGMAHVPGDDGGRGGGPRRSTPADRAARAKRGRSDAAAGNDVHDAPLPKRQSGGAQAGSSGRHGVYELTGADIRKVTPSLTWRAQLHRPGDKKLELGLFATADEAARAYDAEVRRRGWAHAKPLNFPQPEEMAAYTKARERCDERGLPLSLAPEPPAGTQAVAAAQGAAGQPPPKLSGRKPGKSGFFGVIAHKNKNKATQWMVAVDVPGAKPPYVVGHFATKQEAARAYNVEVRRRGWTHIKRLNFPDPADSGAQPPSAAVGAGEAPGPV